MAKFDKKNNVIIWKNCKTDVFYYEGPADSYKSEVKFDGNRIVVSYKDEDGYTTYDGESTGDGHFELSSPRAAGRATLHVLEKGRILEGYWEEGGDKGMWRISLVDHSM